MPKIALSLLFLPASLLAQTYTPVVVEPFDAGTQALANWTPKVFRPAAFELATLSGNGVIRHGVNGAEHNPTPTSNETDTNNQGMRVPVSLVGTAQAVSIQMFVPSSWQGQIRNAGLSAEGTVLDGPVSVLWSLPQLIYRDNGDGPGAAGFYGLDENLGLHVPLLTGSQFQFGRFYQLTISLRDGLVTYAINGQAIYKYLDAEYQPGVRVTQLRAATISTYNFGSSHELYWDNFYASGDFDNDGLDDRTEDLGVTLPTNADTDSDGLLDGSEVDLGSSPIHTDSDGDGLLDGHEVSTVGSDPTRADTDSDGVNDRLDDRPLVQGVSTQFLSTASRDLSADLIALPLSQFVGSNNSKKLSNRNKISNDLQAAAQKLDGRRPAQAAGLLASAETSAMTLMMDGPEKAATITEIQFLRTLVSYTF